LEHQRSPIRPKRREKTEVKDQPTAVSQTKKKKKKKKKQYDEP